MRWGWGMLTAGDIRRELAEKMNEVKSSQELQQAYRNVLKHLDECYPADTDSIDPAKGDPQLLALLDTMLKTEPLAVSVDTGMAGNVPSPEARRMAALELFGEGELIDKNPNAYDLRILLHKIQQAAQPPQPKKRGETIFSKGGHMNKRVRPPFNEEASNKKFQEEREKRRDLIAQLNDELQSLPENQRDKREELNLRIAIQKRDGAYREMTRHLGVQREKIQAEGGDPGKLKALEEQRNRCEGFLGTMNERNKNSLIAEGFDKEKLKTFWDAEAIVELNGGQRKFSASNAPAQKLEGEKRSRLGQLMSRLKRDKTEPAPEPGEKKGHRLSWPKRK